MKIRLWAAAIAIAAIASACGGKNSDKVEKPAPVTGADLWFQYIPADSPIVMANLRPMPQEFVDWLSDGMGPLADMLQTQLDQAIAEAIDEQERAVLTELSGKFSREGLASIGVSLTPRYAMYAIGLSLAMRVELADGAKMRDFIARIETAAGEKAPRAMFQDIEYYTMAEDGMVFALAVKDDEAIIGLMPENTQEQILPVLFGKQRPSENLGDGAVLRDLVDQHGFQGVAAGYFDLQALVRMLTGRGSARTKAIIALSEADLPELSGVCQQEFDDLAAAVPRMVFGYTALDKNSLSTRVLLEMRKDLATEMAGLQKPVHGLGSVRAEKPLFAMGMGLDLDAAMKWLQGKAQAVVEEPYACEEFDELNQAMAEIANEMGAMQGSLPPLVTGMSGMSMVLTDLEMGGFMPSGSGYAMLGVQSPMQLVEMAKAFIPPLAGVSIQPGNPPVAFPTGLPSVPEAHITVQGDWIGMAAGDAEAKALVGRMTQTPPADGPFMVFAYNYSQLMNLIQAANPTNQSAVEQEIVAIVGRMFGFAEASMRFDERGLVMDQRMQSAP